MRRILAITTSLLLVAAVWACDEPPTDLGTADRAEPSVAATGPGADASAATLPSSSASFKTFHQGFNRDTEPWITKEDPGPLGWCGSIERISRTSSVPGRGGSPGPVARGNPGPVLPSVGGGYALVEHGRCNDFFAFGDGFSFDGATSAPATLTPELLSTTYPPSGFVQQLDVYLDPAYPAGVDGPDYDTSEGTVEGLVQTLDGGIAAAVDGVVLHYANSLCVLAEGGCTTFDFRYFDIAVTKDGGVLEVAGHPVTEAGWYTFRHVFGSDAAGNLTVEFQLRRKGRTLFTEPVESTFLTGEATSDFAVDDLGSGYIWFVSIADGLELPIDEHVLRRGK